jgi:hypothetical protein
MHSPLFPISFEERGLEGEFGNKYTNKNYSHFYNKINFSVNLLFDITYTLKSLLSRPNFRILYWRVL